MDSLGKIYHNCRRKGLNMQENLGTKKYLKKLKKVLKFSKISPIGKMSIGGYYEN